MTHFFFNRAPVLSANGWFLTEIKAYPPAKSAHARQRLTAVTFIGADSSEDRAATSRKLVVLAVRACVL
jgi:hypothetical protein